MIEPKTWVEIDQNNISANIKQFKSHIGPNIKLACVVKSNAYGHDIKLISQIAKDSGADWLAVDSLNEALTIRYQEINLPILVMGYIDPANYKFAILNEISFVLYDKQTVQIIDSQAKFLRKKAKIHLKAETGTNRQGIELNEFQDFLYNLKNYQNIEIQGIYTHYANIEDTTDHSYAKKQLETFKKFLDITKNLQIEIPLIHSANSAATMLFQDTYFNMVRTGIGMYGYWPSVETKISAKEKGINFELKSALTWKTKIAQIKEVKEYQPVSYGCTEKICRDSKIAVLPVGYWDGYDRKLSSIGNVLINGKRAKVIGRICMNMMMVDVCHIENIQAGDEAVLLGKQGDEEITAEEIASKLNTINYEIITRINPLLPRILK